MNRLFTLLLLLCLLLSLSACGGKSPDTPPAPESPAAPDPAPPADAEPEDPAPSEDEARRAAFAQILRTAHDRQVLPDGTALDSGGSLESVEGNLFALRDVDGDGAEELVLLWQNAAMAGQLEIVYGYDGAAGQVRQKLWEFPGVLFYDNGTAEAPWSHNQGWAGAFWPYNLYRWQADGDAYETMGSVDAWDSALVSDGFPRDVDGDGDGMIYFLLTDNWNFTAHRDPDTGAEHWYYEQPPVDGEAYLRWREGIVGDAEVLELAFVPLTAENIAGELDVPYEPLITTLTPNAQG